MFIYLSTFLFTTTSDLKLSKQYLTVPCCKNVNCNKALYCYLINPKMAFLRFSPLILFKISVADNTDVGDISNPL